MTLDCIHFRACGLQGGGCCDAGHYGGSVSYGVCVRVCPHRTAGSVHDLPDPAPALTIARAGPPLWDEIHGRPLMFVGDVAGELAYWQSMPDRLPFGCACRDHLTDRLRRRPPALSSPAAYALWTFDLHVGVNANLHKPGLTLAHAADRHGWWAIDGFDVPVRPALAMHTTSSGAGIGDSVVALYAACGLAKATGRTVVYYARWHEWIKRASFPGVIVRPHAEVGVDVSGGWAGGHGYFMATHTRPSRLWAYCANLAAAFDVPAFEGVRPHVGRDRDSGRVGPGVPRRYAVLAPFTSGWPAREWPVSNWAAVAGELDRGGVRPILIGSADQADRLAAWFPRQARRAGLSPADITDMLLGAAVVVSNDSGIAHVGGLLGVPTVCVHAGSLTHEFLFASAPSVASVVNPDGEYGGDSDLPALQAITPAAVLRTIEDVLRRTGESRSTDGRTAVEAASIDS